MSTKAFDSALDFVPENKAEGKGFLASVAAFFAAVREGMEMAQRYQTLTERGMQPAEAAQTAVALAKR